MKINTITKMITAQRDGIKYKFSEDEEEGKIICTIHELGDIISLLRTPIGMLFFIVFIICVFLLMRIIFIDKKKENNPIKDEKFELDNENSMKKTTRVIEQKK